jgi:ubiquinone/menaquinone biosynthesis C-methylase UbiE
LTLRAGLAQALDTDRDRVAAMTGHQTPVGSTQAREAAFHDDIARSVVDRPPRPADHLEVALWQQLGDIRGKAVLELGCGHGDLTMQLIDAGADVVAIDLSEGMVEAARQRIERHRPMSDARVLVASVEETSFADASYDLVVGKWIIHHVDVEAVAREAARVLRPGGRAAFIENSAMNPVLRLARERLIGRFGIPRLGSIDEHPLRAEDFSLLGSPFDSMELVWPDFYFVRLFDRQVLRQRSKFLSAAARAIDDLVYRFVHRLRKSSFHVIVLARVSDRAGT